MTWGNGVPHSGSWWFHGKDGVAGSIPAGGSTLRLLRGAGRARLGASFGYARLATVTATSPMRLLVLANTDLLALMDDVPAIAAQVTRTARDRLPGL